MRLALVLVALGFMPHALYAGAWPRTEGSTFVALSFTGSAELASLAAGVAAGVAASVAAMDGFTGLYLEYGLSPRWTVGLDAGRNNAGATTVLAFARHPVLAGTGKTVLAIKAGIGRSGEGGMTGRDETLVAIGLDAGRGFTSRLGDGWLSLETWVKGGVKTRTGAIKVDLTAGLNLSDRTKVMVQLQAGSYSGSEPYLRLAPSLTRRFGESMTVELGVHAGLIGDRRVGIKLGTWLEF